MTTIALGLALASGAAAGTWTAQNAAAPTMPVSTPLSAVSCADPSHCLAVGGPIAERSHISHWMVLHPAVPSGADSIALNGVSCVSRTSCWAVGSSTAASRTSALAERWDGSSWTIESAFSSATAPETSLAAVSCTADGSCEAVGHYGSTTSPNGSEKTSHGLIERRTASGWKRQSIPSGSIGPTGVSCSSASACTAVGPQESPLRWDGHSWTAQDAGGSLEAVSCPTDDSCWGVGTYNKVFFRLSPLVEHWDGSSWQLIDSPDPDPGEDLQILNGVSCSSDTACTAVGNATQSPGQSESITERWNGHAWRVQTTPPPDPSAQTNDSLNGVSCPTAKSCTSVGYTGPLGFPRTTELSLAERWNGSSWRVQDTPSLISRAGSSLTGVSCSSGTQCTAVGERDTDTGIPGPLAERRHGASNWSVQDVPTPADVFVRGLSGVSCSTSTSCVAVGDGYAEVWDGSSWTAASVATPSGANGAPSLDGVSCVASDDCTAVGSYFDTSVHFLAEHWDGTSWSIEPAPTPAGADAVQTGGVSCRPSFCMAVGYVIVGQDALPFSETWDGSAWTVQTTPNPNPNGALLRAVSCIAQNACTAVGNISGVGPVAERWNGSVWTVQPTPGSGNDALFGVSCAAADSCVAVGETSTNGSQEPVGEHWDGSAWTTDPTPGTDGSQLTSVSCTSRAACVAAGTTGDGSPLIEAYSATPRALVVTGDARRVRRHHAVLHGTVDPRGRAVTQCEFTIAAAGSPAIMVPCRQDPGDGSGAVSVSARVRNLSRGTTYRYQLVATDGGGQSRGAVKTFETRTHRHRR